MAYRTIDPRMWDDDRFLALSVEARFLWIYLLTGPHTTPLPGIYVAGVGSISDGMRTVTETVSRGLAELSEAGLAEVDATHRIIRIPNAPKYNPPANANVLKGWFNLWSGLPECALKQRHIESIRLALQGNDSLPPAFAATFGTVRATVTETQQNGSAKPAPTHEHDHHHDHGHGQLPVSAAPAPEVVVVPAAPVVGTTKAPRKPRAAVVAPEGDVLTVWTAYLAVKPDARCTPDRVALIAKWLGIYSVTDLVRTIRGYSKSSHHRGQNERGTEYLDIELFLRSAKYVEAGWSYLNSTPGADKPNSAASRQVNAHWAERQAEILANPPVIDESDFQPPEAA